MKLVAAILLVALIGGVCCKPNKTHPNGADSLSSSSSSSSSSSEEFDNQIKRVRRSDQGNSGGCRFIQMFLDKLENRIRSSYILANNPNKTNHFMTIASNDLKACEDQINDVMPCMSFATSRVMGLIHSYENYEKSRMNQMKHVVEENN